MIDFKFNSSTYKALPPEETIKKIRDILHANNIFIIEKQWFHDDRSGLVSLALATVGSHILTNGKGRNEKYALASAYGEFIERLQNLLLVDGIRHSGNQPRYKIKFQDSIPIDYYSFKKGHYDVLRSFFKVETIDQLEVMCNEKVIDNIFASPYFNTKTERIDYLPDIFMRLAIGSNGMCAGNTPEEAFIQGICEIFERYVLKQIYLDQDISFPVVPDHIMKDSSTWKYIQFFRSKGFEISVKDCSLCGNLPVAGVLIQKDDKASFHLGSSPDFFVAVERCFTEMMQGMTLDKLTVRLQPIHSLDAISTDRKNLSTARKRINYQFYKSLRSSSGIVHPVVFKNNAEFIPEHLFRSDDLIGKSVFKNLIKIAERLGCTTYIRDVSFLGFPSYHIYVHGMSEMIDLDPDDLILRLKTVKKAKKIFFSLNKADESQIRYLINALEKMRNDPYVDKDMILQLLHHLALEDGAVLNTLDPENLISLLYYKLGEYSSAYKVLDDYLKDKLGFDRYLNPSSFALRQLCLLKFYELRAKRYDLKTSKAMIENDFDISLIDEIYPVLEDSSLMADYLGIPECVVCETCKYNDMCCFEEIDTLAVQLQSQINLHSIDQNRIKAYL